MAFHFNVSKEWQTAQAFTKQKVDFSEDKEWRVDLGYNLSCMVDDLMGGLFSIELSCHVFFWGVGYCLVICFGNNKSF